MTFGCKVNQYETQAIREAWVRAGGVETGRADEACLVLVNSCAITGRAERDARNALIRLQREAPGALLVLTGCAARLVADFVPRRHAPKPEADCIVVQERKEDLCRPGVIERLVQAALRRTEGAGLPAEGRASGAQPGAGAGAALVPADLFPVGPAHWRDFAGRPWPGPGIGDFRRVRPVLKVQDGCSHRCTYCIVPYTRGPHVSREPGEVLAEAARLLEDHAELMISGVNLGQYGRDRPDYGNFWQLLARLEDGLGERLAGRRRLRISSLEPSQLTEEACRFLASSGLVAPHLHISLQHASFAVLKRMGRGHYTADTLREAVARLADAWPVMGLGADILVGFPGETAQDVEELCRFVEEMPFSYAHVFPYSRRPGTPAAGFADQLPKKEKMARAAAVREVVAGRARAFWQAQAQVPVMRLALDAGEGHVLPGHVHGVNAVYAPCFLPVRAMDGLPAGAGHREFVAVRPVGVCDRGLVVEPCGGSAG